MDTAKPATLPTVKALAGELDMDAATGHWPRPPTSGILYWSLAGQRDRSRVYRAWEVMLPVIVVTRLRLKDPALLNEFFTAAVAALEQAKSSAGCLGTDVLADANNVWWTLTAWQDRGPMRAFTGSEPHLSTMARIDDWCDEATFADWEQRSPDLPDWQASYGRLIADGQVASLTHASDAHVTRAFPAPVGAS